MKKPLIILALAVLVLGVALPYAPIDFLKGPLEGALARGLGRKVEVDSVAFTLFSGPGFSLDGVIIHEDPRAGIEPFVYANTLDARLDPLALLRGRLEFSSLNLNDATFNLVKPDDAPWNFQMLLNQTSSLQAGSASLPALKMRGGRVNFKFGQSKSVLFFDDTDLDVSPGANGAMNLRFSGAPARTDRAAENFGHFFVRGTSTPSAAGPRLDLRVELEPSSLDAVARLFAPGALDLKGVVSLDAQVTGAPSRLDVNGTAELEGGRAWRVGYKGTLDLVGQTLHLEADAPLKIRVNSRNLLTRPEWDLAAELTDMPVAGMLDAARLLGVALPPKLAVDGAANGVLRYDNVTGLGGNVELSDIVMTLPDATPLKASTATVFIKNQTILVGPVTVGLGDSKETAEVVSTYQAGEGGGLEFKVSTRRMSLSSLAEYGLAAGPLAIPMMDRVKGGSWNGALRYTAPAGSPAAWSGDFQLQSTQLAVEGLAEPVRLINAAVSVIPERVTLTRMRGSAGEVDFSGDCQWDTDGIKPPSLRIRVEDGDVGEVARLLQPAALREGSLFARTLGIGSSDAPPAWLAKRRAEGTLTVKSLTVAGATLSAAARLAWTGPSITLSGIRGKLADASLAGDLNVDLSGRAPAYVFTGKLEDVAYRGGKLDFNGTLEAAGSGLALLASVHAGGVLLGRSLALSPDADYRRVSGRFALSMTPAGPLWKLSGLELAQGADIFVGDGNVKADGKVALDIHRN